MEFNGLLESLIRVNALSSLVNMTGEVAKELLPQLSVVGQRLLLIILELVLNAFLLDHSMVPLRHEFSLIRREVGQGQRNALLLLNPCNEMASAAKT